MLSTKKDERLIILLMVRFVSKDSLMVTPCDSNGLAWKTGINRIIVIVEIKLSCSAKRSHVISRWKETLGPACLHRAGD